MLTKMFDIIMGKSEKYILRHRFLNIMLFISFIGCVICFFTNLLYDKDMITALLCFIASAFIILMYYFSRFKNKYKIVSTLTFFIINLFFLPLFWVNNDGMNSGIHFYYFITAGVSIIIFTGTKKIVYFIINIFIYISLVYIQYRYPQIIKTYTYESNKYFDIGLDSIIVMFIIAVMYFAIVRSYDLEHKKVNKLIKIDDLSGCYNRRFFINSLKEAIKVYEDKKNTFSLILIDIDNFKEINDTMGHLAGDKLISQIGKLLKKNVKENYYISRYGGDEFTILMRNTNILEAKSFAEKICNICCNTKWFDNEIKLTLSIGVCEYNGGGVTRIINEVDNKLYKAKLLGKNQVSW